MDSPAMVALKRLALVALVGCGNTTSGGDAATDGSTSSGDGSQADAASKICPPDQPDSSTSGIPGPGGGPPIKSVCTQDGTNCNYGASCCVCETTPSCGGAVLWWCGQTNAPAPCPSASPLNGDACSIDPNARCTYCTPNGLFLATCSGGKWTVGPPAFGCAG